MKVVLDTNVLISGIFFGGLPSLILKAWREGRFSLVLSPEILAEYSQTANILAEDHPPIDLRSILEVINNEAEFCEAPALPSQICTDPADDKFLACALASGARLVVSGDKHLLKVSRFRNIQIMKPRAFLDTFLS